VTGMAISGWALLRQAALMLLLLSTAWVSGSANSPVGHFGVHVHCMAVTAEPYGLEKRGEHILDTVAAFIRSYAARVSRQCIGKSAQTRKRKQEVEEDVCRRRKTAECSLPCFLKGLFHKVYSLTSLALSLSL
jgi:hypothetical protein